MRRRGEGMRGSIVMFADESFAAMRRSGRNGRGGEGSAASLSPPFGKRESGSLFSRESSPSCEYSGEEVGSDGSSSAVITSTTLCGAEGSLCSSGGDSTMRPAGKGRGGEGSEASSSPSVGNRDRATGTLSSRGFPSTRGYLGKGLGGDGSFHSTTRSAGNGLGGEGSAASFSPSVGKRDNGMGAGRAILSEMRTATTGKRIDSFIVMLSDVERPKAGYQSMMLETDFDVGVSVSVRVGGRVSVREEDEREIWTENIYQGKQSG